MPDIAANIAMPLWYGFLALLGLCAGSFLNVVIMRLPIMLERIYLDDCRTAAKDSPEPVPEPPLNLAWPGSRCPNCTQALGVLDLIPLLSYCWLKGRCRYCQQPISIQYPLVESAALLIAVLPFLLLPSIAQATAAVIAGWFLLALSVIDFNRQWLPDSLVYPLLWLGLLVNCFEIFVGPVPAIMGAVSGYLSLWLLALLFKLITGKIGMGHGDFKLLAAAGAWLGPISLPGILLIAALLGLLFSAYLMILKRWQKDTPIAFGPWLAIGFWSHLLWGGTLTNLLVAL